MKTETLENFHREFFDLDVTSATNWMGRSAKKCPLDLWVYQEIIWECRPDIIIECGVSEGGTTLFLACMLETIDSRLGSMVFGIDNDLKATVPSHRRILYHEGDDVSPETLQWVSARVGRYKRVILDDHCDPRVMVILDSEHTREHVAKQLELYSPLVSERQYLIVEDTNISGHPVCNSGYGMQSGPWEAVHDFLSRNQNFVIDSSREKYKLTYNPHGYLTRVGQRSAQTATVSMAMENCIDSQEKV